MRKILSIVLLGVLVISCREKTEVDGPELIIDVTSLSFNDDIISNEIIITNAGEKTLSWEISALPQWLSSDILSGDLEKGSKKVTFSVNTNSSGSYSGAIKITSNGGVVDIDVSLTLTDKPVSAVESLLEFTPQNATDTLILVNDGDETFDWQFNSYPRWIRPSEISGKLAPGSKKILLTANPDNTSSNLSSLVTVNISGKEINIVSRYIVNSSGDWQEASFLAGVYLYTSYANLKGILGQPSETDVFENDYGYYIHGVYYNDRGLSYYFAKENADDLYNSDEELFFMEAYYPYTGTNQLGLGLESTLIEMENIYGTGYSTDVFTTQDNNGDDITFDVYEFVNKGIGFLFFKEGNYRYIIDFFIYKPNNNKSVLENPYYYQIIKRRIDKELITLTH